MADNVGLKNILTDLEKGVKPVSRIFLVSPGEKKSFCGPGMIALLLAIKETGNVRQACANMEMSYTKGWKLLKVLEVWLGFPVVVRRQGGKKGGEARLTDKGHVFLENHQAFLQECQNAIQGIFERYYGESSNSR